MSKRVKRGTYRRSCRKCPWTGTYSTAAMADRAKRAHSCERWIRKAEAAERGRARMEAIDRTPKPCLHKGEPHRHGEYVTYVWDHCRCVPCKEAATEYERERVRQQAYGRWDNLVDAEPVRRHVLKLMAAGMGLKRIAALAGVSNGSATKLIYGTYAKTDGPPRGCKGKGDVVRPPARRVRKETAEKWLSVKFEYTERARVDGSDTARRLQALMAIGWSGQKLGERLGILRANMTPLIHGRGDVTVARAEQVHKLYLELADQAPPEDNQRDRIAASRARNYARQMGWSPPLRINGKLVVGTPLPEPIEQLTEPVELSRDDYDEAVVLRVVNERTRPRYLSTAEGVEVIRRLLAQGYSRNEIEHGWGFSGGQYAKLVALVRRQQEAS